MAEPQFDQPSIHLNRIYTRAGDTGDTRLAGGQRISKTDLRIECYGTVDELNSFLGMARVTAEEQSATAQTLAAFAAMLKQTQHQLFNLGSLLATLPEDIHPKQATITAKDVEALERAIDEANGVLPALRSFVLPGSSRLEVELHVCRTVCRRAERLLIRLSTDAQIPAEAIQYLNRLSDAFFVWSRWVNHVLHRPETLWEPNAAAGGSR